MDGVKFVAVTVKNLRRRFFRHATFARAADEPPQPGREVMLPGDPEKKATALRSREGIPVDPLTWKKFGELTAEFGVPLQVVR